MEAAQRIRLPYRDGERFLTMLERAIEDCDTDLVGANVQKLRRLIARYQDRALELAKLQHRPRLILDQHEPSAAERFIPKGKHKGHVPRGSAKCTKAVPGDAENYPETYEYNDATKTLHVGDGEFAPVAPEVYEFEVSGLKVVQSWLGYRKKKPKGKKSSPLDEINPDRWPSDFTTELLELLWVLEATIAECPAQAKLLSAVVRGKCFKGDELPPVPDAARKPPARPSANVLFDVAEDEDE